MLANFAQKLYRKKPRKYWARHQVKAHRDKLILQYSKGLNYQQKQADLAFKYTLYFKFLAQKIEEYSIQPEFLYNMDKKGFMIRVTTKAKRVFFQYQYKERGLKQQL